MWMHPAGLTGLAFPAKDAEALHGDLLRAGVAVEDCKDFSRPVMVDGQEKTASFRTFQIDRQAVANGRIFFCQHNTPELIWRPEWQSHPNGATGIAAVTIVSEEPDRLNSLLAAGLGIPTDGNVCAGRTTLRVLRPAQMAELSRSVPHLPDLANAPMRMAALDVFTSSLEMTAACLEAGKVPFVLDDRAVTIAPDIALGLVLRFIENGK